MHVYMCAITVHPATISSVEYKISDHYILLCIEHICHTVSANPYIISCHLSSLHCTAAYCVFISIIVAFTGLDVH